MSSARPGASGAQPTWNDTYQLEQREKERAARIVAQRLAHAEQVADRVTEEMQPHRERVRGCPLHIRTAFELLGMELLIREWRRAGLL